MIAYEKKYDVVVAGAGVAGVSAALEIARAGFRVALIEKTVMSGGLATAGFVNGYLPLCDGLGTQVSFGLAEELLIASKRYGTGDESPTWRQSRKGSPAGRYMLVFSPAAFSLAMDELMTETASLDRWYDTLVCAAIVENGRIKGIEVENKSGRGRLLADIVIDATGDGDIAARAGCPFVEDGNKLTIWALQADLRKAERAIEKDDGAALCNLHQVGLEGEDINPETKHLAYPWRGTNGKAVTRFVIKTHEALLEHYKKLHAKGGATSRKKVYPLALPTMAQFRTTRAITGRATLSGGMAWCRSEDSIALVADWRRRGSVWEIPWGAMIPPSVKGLITAGRCISSTGDAWEVTRSIPPAAQTGQVAGIASVISLREGTLPGELAVTGLQGELRRKNLPFHFEDVGLTPPV